MAIDHPDLSRARDPSTPAEVLTRLAAAVVDRLASTPRTEYEIQLRAAIAANANTPRVTQLEIINRTSGTVTLVRAGSDLFEGDTAALISTGASWSITSDASANWYLN